MNALLSGFAALAMLASPLFAQDTSFSVHPVTGQDVIGGGTPAAPFKTVGFAAAQPFVGHLTINLLPGTYSPTSNGESFPIALTAPVTVRGLRACSVTIENSTSTAGVIDWTFTCVLGPSTGAELHFEDLEFLGSSRGIYVETLTMPETAQVSMKRIRSTLLGTSAHGLYMDVRGTGGSKAELSIEDCESYDSQSAATLNVHEGAELTWSAKRCRYGFQGFYQQPFRTFMLLVRDTAKMTGVIDRCSFTNRKLGVATAANVTGQLDMTMVHCAAQGMGVVSPITGQTFGGVIDDYLNSQFDISSGLTWHIEQNVFFDNANEIRWFAEYAHKLSKNLVQDPTLLLAQSGQFTGDPLWRDPDKGDFHLLPGSPCLDKGDVFTGAISNEFDFEGDSRTTCSGAPDLGPDEFFGRDLVLGQGWGRADLGTDLDIHFTSAPNEVALIFLGTPATSYLPCIDFALDLASPIAFLAGPIVAPPGPSPTTSYKTQFKLPTKQLWVGTKLTLAAVFLDATLLGYPSAHSRTLTLCK